MEIGDIHVYVHVYILCVCVCVCVHVCVHACVHACVRARACVCGKCQNVLKGNRALWLQFSIQSFDYGATTVAKVSLYAVHCKFWHCLVVESGPCIAVKQTS